MTLKQKPILWIAWSVCLLSTLFYCFEYILRIEPSMMVLPLERHFHMTALGFGFLVSVYYYAYAPLQLVVGAITDYFGTRKILVVAVSLCVLGCIIFPLSHFLIMASFARLLMGVGSAFAFVAVLRLASIWLPKNHFAFFVGVATTLGMLGALLTDVHLPRLVQVLGWQQTFYGSALIGLLMIPLFYFWVYEPEPAKKQRRNRVDISEIKHSLLALFRCRSIIIAAILGCFLFTSLSVLADTWGIEYLRVNWHVSLQQAGWLNSLIYAGWLLGAPVMGWLSDLLQSRRLLLMIGSWCAFCLLWSLYFISAMPVGLLGVVLFLFGVASSSEVLCFAVVNDCVRPRFVATGFGFVNAVIMLGGLIFQPIFSFFLVNQTRIHDAHAIQLGFHHGLLFLLTIYLIAFVIACIFSDTYHKGVTV